MPNNQRNRRIATEYRKGASSYDLADEWDLSPIHILRIVRSQGGQVRSAAESLLAMNALPARMENAIVRMYKAGNSMADVGYHFSISVTKVRRILIAKKEKVRKQGQRL